MKELKQVGTSNNVAGDCETVTVNAVENFKTKNGLNTVSVDDSFIICDAELQLYTQNVAEYKKSLQNRCALFLLELETVLKLPVKTVNKRRRSQTSTILIRQ